MSHPTPPLPEAYWQYQHRRALAEVRYLCERRQAHSLKRQAAERDAAELRRSARAVLRELTRMEDHGFVFWPLMEQARTELQAAADVHQPAAPAPLASSASWVDPNYPPKPTPRVESPHSGRWDWWGDGE